MTMTLNQSPIISMETSRRAKTEWITLSSIKCHAFAHCSSSIVMAWCMMNSWHKFAWSIGNSSSKSSGKIELWIMHQLTYQCLCLSFLPKKKNRNHASTTVFTGLVPCWLFSLPRTTDTDERKTFCYDWGGKEKIESEKASFRSVASVFIP